MDHAMETNHDLQGWLDRSLSGHHVIGKALSYRSLYLPAKQPVRWMPSSTTARRPVLLLGGTSISIEDMKELFLCLHKADLDVACIQTPMGGLFDIGIEPKTLRPLCLCDFIERIQTARPIQGLDIIAHSYAAYEVLRLLTDDPLTYRPLVKSIFLINPPGFNDIAFIPHLLRILRHITGGYVVMTQRRFSWANDSHNPARPGMISFAKREILGIKAMASQGAKNPVRTFREIKDVVTYKIARPIQTLRSQYGYTFNLFLNSWDKMVPAEETLRAVNQMLPPLNIKIVPGGHNDLLFQQWQRAEFLSFLLEGRG